MEKYGVAVIGLGAVGSAALYQLSQSKLNIIGIDRYAPPHALGSSSGESRITRQAIGEGESYTPMVLRAHEIWSELSRLSGEKLFDPCGMLIAGYPEQRFFRTTLRAAQDFAIDHHILSGEEVERLFPAIQAPTTEHIYYYEPTSGYLKPEKCIEVQLRLARENGAEILLNTRVDSVVENRNGITIRLGEDRTVEVEKVIVANGPWLKEIFPQLLEPILKTYLQRLHWFDINKTHYHELTPEAMPVFLAGFEQAPTTRAFSGFPALAGTTGGVKFTMDESDTIVNPQDKDTIEVNPESAEELYGFVSRYIKHVLPNTLRSFNCVYTATPDGDFILDFLPGSERIIIGSACSAHGFKHSAATGEALAQLATTGASTLDISKFSLSRFS